MAKLKEFDRRYDLLFINWAVNYISGIFAFDIKELNATDEFIECKAFEKNFWGRNKLKGYFILAKLDNSEEPLLRFECQCAYGTYKTHHFIGGDRVEIFNFNYFMSSIEGVQSVQSNIFDDTEVHSDVEYGLKNLVYKAQNLNNYTNLSGLKSMLQDFKYPNVKQ